MKNILIVGPYPPPYGGISSNVRELPLFLKQKGINGVWVLSENKLNSLKIIDGFNLIELNLKSNWPDNFRLLNLKRLIQSYNKIRQYRLGWRDTLKSSMKAIYIRKMIEEKKIDHIIFMDSWVSEVIIPVLKNTWKLTIPIMSMAWGVSKRLEFYNSRKNMLTDIINYSNSIWASSNYCARGVEMIGISSNKIDTIYLGVDINRYQLDNTEYINYRNKNHLSETTPIVLFVGRMNKEMGLDVVLKMIPLSLKENPAISFIIIGANGELTQEALKLQALYPGNLKVHVNAPFDLVENSTKICDILLAPSMNKHACMGMSIKQAMACGKVVIASSSGGIPEAIINNESGFLLPINNTGNLDVKNIVSTLSNLLNNPIKMKKIGEGARIRAIKFFSKEKSYQKILSLLSKLS